MNRPMEGETEGGKDGRQADMEEASKTKEGRKDGWMD